MNNLSENQDAVNMLEDAVCSSEKDLLNEGFSGTAKADKLKEKYKNSSVSYEQVKPYISHLESLCTLPRCAGFGGWPCEVRNNIKWSTFKHKNLALQEEIFHKMSKECSPDKALQSDYNLNDLADFKKACEKGIRNFIKWYLKNIPTDETTCEYCGVTQKKCREYLERVATDYGGNKRNKGKTLELERKNSQKGQNIYQEDNCIWICHVCNNAKSDLFTEDKFKKTIARGIRDFWNL